VQIAPLSAFPLSTPLPLKTYQPKKKYYCLSAGNTQKYLEKGTCDEKFRTKKAQSIPNPDTAYPYW